MILDKNSGTELVKFAFIRITLIAVVRTTTNVSPIRVYCINIVTIMICVNEILFAVFYGSEKLQWLIILLITINLERHKW